MRMSELVQAIRRWGWAPAGFAALAAFAVLAGRFWHPFYGFTKFVQLDEADARSGIHEIRENPVFVYEGFNGYDGAAYTQIAFHPLLDSPELQPALGNVPYRARRILGSALAWLLAGGSPAHIANVYAGLNLAVWLVLAALLWRALPVIDARSWLAWVGVLFSAGALHSVRLALTDLLAATLVAGAIVWNERRPRTAIAVLGLAGLARETAVAAVVALWRGPWRSPRAWVGNLRRSVLVALPLVLWIAYVHGKAGPAPQGFGNFTWPVVGWIEKWAEVVGDFGRHPQFRWLTATTLLAVIGLTAQAAYFLRRVVVRDPWWRTGVAGVAMMAVLGTSVWEGNPGAATRVLLPMSIAFAVFAVRQRAHAAWIIVGGLTAFSGVLALWHVPPDPRELGAGRYGGGAYVAQAGPGWYGVERDGNTAWAWSAGRAEIAMRTFPPATSTRLVRVKLRGISDRAIEISDGAGVVWRGTLREGLEWIEFPAAPREHGRLVLTVMSSAPPVRESEHAEARALSFVVYGVQLK